MADESSGAGGFAGFLASISWPIVSRVLAALGVGTVTYTGLESAISNGIETARNALTGLTPDVLAILNLAGFFDVMALTAGSLTGAVAWMVLKRFALSTTGPSGASS